jgi:hypothetical protein
VVVAVDVIDDADDVSSISTADRLAKRIVVTKNESNQAGPCINIIAGIAVPIRSSPAILPTNMRVVHFLNSSVQKIWL